MNRHCVRNYIDGKEIFSMSNYLSKEVIVVCSNFYNLAAGMSQGHVTFFLIIKDDIHAQLTFNV